MEKELQQKVLLIIGLIMLSAAIVSFCLLVFTSELTYTLATLAFLLLSSFFLVIRQPSE